MLALLLFIVLSVFLLFLPDLLNGHNDKSRSSQSLMMQKNGAFSFSKEFLKLSSTITKFKELIQKDFRVFFLWMQGLIVWVIGFYSWIFQINDFYMIGTFLSVLFCSLSIYVKSSTIKTDFDWF